MKKVSKSVISILSTAIILLSAGCGFADTSLNSATLSDTTISTDAPIATEPTDSTEPIDQALAPPPAIIIDTTPPADNVDISDITPSTYPKVDGSTATLPLSQSLYAGITGADMGKAADRIIHSKTTQSYLNLIEGTADLLIVAEANLETEKYAAEQGVELLAAPIALDAFVFMVNEENPVQSLTLSQIQDIYAGKTKNWSQVGGNDQPIVAFQRNPGAGSQTLMEEMVMEGIPMEEAPSMMAHSMMAILENIAAYNNVSNAIGYSVYYYANLMEQTPGLRFMGVEGHIPSAASIQDGTYPLISKYYAVIRSSEALDSPARRLYDYLRSPAGQQLVQAERYVPFSLQAEASPSTATPNEAGEAGYTLLKRSPVSDLPIENDEALLICWGNFNYTLLDRDLRIIGHIQNVLRTSLSHNSGIQQNTEVVKKTEPLVFYTLPATLGEEKEIEAVTDEEGIDLEMFPDYGKDWAAGLYDPQTGSWILTPIHRDVIPIGDSRFVVVDQSDTALSGMQITVVDAAGETLQFYLDGEVLRSNNYEHIPTGFLLPDAIYDLHGNMLAAEPDAFFVTDIFPNSYTLQKDGKITYKSWKGEIIKRAEDSWYIISVDTGDKILEVWRNSNDANDIMQDSYYGASGQIVMNVNKFLEINQEYAEEEKLSDEYFMHNGYDEKDHTYNIRCKSAIHGWLNLLVDHNFVIQGPYQAPPEEPSEEYVPYTLQFREDGQAEIVNEKTGEKIPVDVKKNTIERVSRLAEGVFFLSPLHRRDPRGCFYADGRIIVRNLAGCKPTDTGAILIASYDEHSVDGEFPTSSGCYVYATGSLIPPKEGAVIRYFDETYYCYTQDGYAYFMDYEGNLYFRLRTE